MLSLIHNETVVKNHWLSNAEFTDIVAISQSTPGPIGINCATYVGYTACLHDGYPVWAAWLGSVLASLSIMWLPFIIMILIIAMFFQQFKDNYWVAKFFAGVRPAVVALIAAPCFKMAKTASINRYNIWIPFVCCALIAVFGISPIYIIIAAGVLGWLYGKVKR